MADDLSLLFKLRADNVQAKAAIAEMRAAVGSLKQSFGTDLAAMQGISQTALSSIGNNLNAFVGARIPLVGGAFIRVSESLRGLGEKAKEVTPEVAKLASSITSLAQVSGKSTTEITAFLKSFVAIETQAARNAAAIGFFGSKTNALSGEVKSNFTPQLEAAAAQMAATTLASGGTEGAISSLATAFGGAVIPIAVAVAALAAVVVVLVEIEQKLIADATAFSKYGDELDRASQKTKLSVEQLSALRVVAKDNEVSFDSLVLSLSRYLRNADEAAHTSGELRDAFISLGIDAEQAAKNPQEAVLQLFQAFERLGPSVAENTAVQKLLGRSGTDLIPVLRAIHGNLNEASERAKRFGLSMDKDAVKGATALDNALDDLSDQWEGIKLGIGQAAAPAVIELVTAFTSLLNASKPAFELIGIVGIPIMKQLTTTTQALAGVIALATGNYVELARISAQIFGTQATPETKTPPVPTLTPPPTSDGRALKNLNDLKALAVEADRLADEAEAKSDNLFTLGQITEGTRTETHITQIKKRAAADRDALEAQINLKYDELRALTKADSDYAKKVAETGEQIRVLRQQQDDVASKAREKEEKLRTDLQAKQRKDTLDHQQALTDAIVAASQARIRVIEFEVRTGIKTAEDGEKEIEKAEEDGFTARKAILDKALQQAGVDPAARQKVLDQLKKLEQERTDHLQVQAERRNAITEQEVANDRAIRLDFITTDLRIGQIRDAAQTAAIKALAATRIKTEEQAAKDVLKVRLEALDREAKAVQAQLAIANETADPLAKDKAQADASNKLRAIAAERKAITEQGNRDQEEGRQKDLQNEQKYADELIRLKEQIRDVQRDAAREAINLLVIQDTRGKNRREIIRKQAALDIQDEKDRHSRAEASIAAERVENDKSNRTHEEKIVRTEELNRLAEAEEKRHRLALEGITTKEAKDDKQAARDADRETPLGKLKIDIQDIKDFAEELEKSIVPLNVILKESFYQVADAIGSVVEQWVLYGETGPAVMRKILAAALATIAKEAAVNAVKELAIGFAMLFINPADSAAHFISAGLWASLAGGAALAGRGIAGDSFKQKPASSGSGSGGSGGTGQQNTIIQGRNQPEPQRLIVEFRMDDSKFGRAITAHVVEQYRKGELRDVIINDGQGG